MIVGGYTLDLYCDVQGCEEHVRVSELTETGARKTARKMGWTVRITADECYCPGHKGRSGDRI